MHAHKYLNDLGLVYSELCWRMDKEDYDKNQLAKVLSDTFNKDVLNRKGACHEAQKLWSVKLLEGNPPGEISEVIKGELKRCILVYFKTEKVTRILAYTIGTQFHDFLKDGLDPELVSPSNLQKIHDQEALDAVKNMIYHRDPSEYQLLYDPEYNWSSGESEYRSYIDELRVELNHFADVKSLVEKSSFIVDSIFTELTKRNPEDLIFRGAFRETSEGELETARPLSVNEMLEQTLLASRDIAKTIFELPEDRLSVKLKAAFIKPLESKVSEFFRHTDVSASKPLFALSDGDLKTIWRNYDARVENLRVQTKQGTPANEQNKQNDEKINTGGRGHTI